MQRGPIRPESTATTRLPSMAARDWFRNVDWDRAVEDEFRKRLSRARTANRPQYLRIQAHHLRHSHPRDALRLLDEYFELGDHIDSAMAYVTQAHAYLTLGDVTAAIGAYERALAREHEFPNLQTGAELDLACLVAAERIESLYQRALGILNHRAEQPAFPVERYRTHGARSLILAELGLADEAARAANAAVEAAQETHSGFRNHPDLGLVRGMDDEFGRRVKQVARAGAPSPD